MHYVGKKSGLIKSAEADVTLNPVGDVYDLSYSAKLVLGKGWFTKTIRKSGSLRVQARIVSEDVIKHAQMLDIDGTILTRSGEDCFDFSQDGASGKIYYALDGFDPVDITKVVVRYQGQVLELERA